MMGSKLPCPCGASKSFSIVCPPGTPVRAMSFTISPPSHTQTPITLTLDKTSCDAPILYLPVTFLQLLHYTTHSLSLCTSEHMV